MLFFFRLFIFSVLLHICLYFLSFYSVYISYLIILFLILLKILRESVFYDIIKDMKVSFSYYNFFKTLRNSCFAFSSKRIK